MNIEDQLLILTFAGDYSKTGTIGLDRRETEFTADFSERLIGDSSLDKLYEFVVDHQGGSSQPQLRAKVVYSLSDPKKMPELIRKTAGHIELAAHKVRDKTRGEDDEKHKVFILNSARLVPRDMY
ncbi:MAG: hypothetical protein WCP89_04570, partial [archaeon]